MGNLRFIFNDLEFSDRILRIEIISEDSVVKVTSLNVCSRILASESPFFYKLFENGMRESHQKEVALKIDTYEEASLLDLLNFMYINTLSAITVDELRGVLIIADKFEAISCMRHCTRLLQKHRIRIPREYEVNYDKCSFVLSDESAQQLKDAAKKYIIEQFKDFNKQTREEAMKLPLSALEIVLGSDTLQVKSEDDVLQFVFKWARSHYPKIDDQRQVIDRLAQFMYFQYMSPLKLTQEVLHVCDFDQIKKSKARSQHYSLVAMDQPVPTNVGRFTKRMYKSYPVNSKYFKSHSKGCVIYFDLMKQECENLFMSSTRLYSQPIFLGGRRRFHLFARCKNGTFGLFLAFKTTKCYGIACTIDYEFQVKMMNSSVYESKLRVENCDLSHGLYVGKENLFGISWTDFIADDSLYFINGILHLRVELMYSKA